MCYYKTEFVKKRDILRLGSMIVIAEDINVSLDISFRNVARY